MNAEYLAEISKLKISKKEYSDCETKLCAMLKMVEDITDFDQKDNCNTGKCPDELRADAVCTTEVWKNICITVPKVVE